MTALPSNMSFGIVRGRFGTSSLLSGDADSLPDFAPLVGLTVTFTASVDSVINRLADPSPVTIVMDPVVCTIDPETGYLLGGDGIEGIHLIATDDPDIDPHGDWTYEITYGGASLASKLVPFTITVPAGSDRWITNIADVPSSIGVSLTQAEAAQDMATLYASQAATSAAEAAATAAYLDPLATAVADASASATAADASADAASASETALGAAVTTAGSSADAAAASATAAGISEAASIASAAAAALSETTATTGATDAQIAAAAAEAAAAVATAPAIETVNTAVDAALVAADIPAQIGTALVTEQAAIDTAVTTAATSATVAGDSATLAATSAQEALTSAASVADGPAIVIITYSGDNIATIDEDGVVTSYTWNPDGTVATDTRNGITRDYLYVDGDLTRVS